MFHPAPTVAPRSPAEPRDGVSAAVSRPRDVADATRAVVARSGAATGLALAGMSGALFATAFPPLSWWALAWIALVPLLVACTMLGPRRAALAGLCWAVAAGAGTTWFLPGMLAGYFGLGALASVLGAAVLIGLNGACVAAYAAWVAWLVGRRAASPLLIAGGWLACELVRAQMGFPGAWGLIAATQVAWTPVVQIADLAGPYGIGLLVAAVNATLAALLVPALRGRRPALAVVAVAAALVASIAYGSVRLGQTFADGPPVEVAVVQAGATPSDRAQRPARLARSLTMTEAAAASGADLVVWPEYAVEAYLEEASPTRDAVLAASRDSGADLLVGGPHFAPSPAGTRYHNSAYLIRDGRLAGRYDKHRLVPVAEDDRLAWLAGTSRRGYHAGSGGFVLQGSKLRLGASLCVESMFPALARDAAGEDADVLVNLSNDAWFGHAAPARHQLDVATLRAVEARRFLIRAAATGVSAVIDPHGRTVTLSAFDTHEVLRATVRGSQTRTPYQIWGDAPAWATLAAVAIATLRCRRSADRIGQATTGGLS